MILFALLLAAAPARAQTAPIVATEIAPVVDMIYDLRFDSAAAAVDAFALAHPGHPAGPFWKGIVIYQRFAFEDVPSTSEVKAFAGEMLRAEELARAWVATSPATGYYYLGAAMGFHARLLASQGRYFRAMPEGLRGIKALRKALAIDPSLIDADLALGLYHYFRSNLPVLAKPFAFLVSGEFGGRELGLSELARAAAKGTLSKTEAQSALANIYVSDTEGKWDKAAGILAELMQAHPRYPIYRLRRAYALEREGRFPDAAALAEPGPWLDALDAATRSAIAPPALYRASEAWLLAGKPDKAEPLLRRLEATSVPPAMVDWVVLRRANVWDAQGDGLAADRLYRAVRDAAAGRAAKRFLKERYPKGPRTVKPLTGVESPS